MAMFQMDREVFAPRSLNTRMLRMTRNKTTSNSLSSSKNLEALPEPALYSLVMSLNGNLVFLRGFLVDGGVDFALVALNGLGRVSICRLLVVGFADVVESEDTPACR